MHFDVRGCWRFMFCVYFSRTRNCIFRSKELYLSRAMRCNSVQILVLRTFLTQGGKTSVKVDAKQDAKDAKLEVEKLDGAWRRTYQHHQKIQRNYECILYF